MYYTSVYVLYMCVYQHTHVYVYLYACVPLCIYIHEHLRAHPCSVYTCPAPHVPAHTAAALPPAPVPPRLSASAWRLPHAAGPPGSFAYCPRGSQWAARGGAALGGALCAPGCRRRHVGVPAAPLPSGRGWESGGWESSAPRGLYPNERAKYFSAAVTGRARREHLFARTSRARRWRAGCVVPCRAVPGCPSECPRPAEPPVSLRNALLLPGTAAERGP